MARRPAFFLACFVLLAGGLNPAEAGAAPPAALAASARAFPGPPLKARAAVVLDATNGKILYGVNTHLRLPMASTTKIMTALMALELGKLSDRITVPAAAFNYESDATVMGLHPGEVVTLRDLLYGLLLPSGADAANTIAIHYGASEQHFVAMMNHEAALLGMVDTHYVDATGLSSANHFSSAYDLAVLGQYVSYLPDIRKITTTRSYPWNGRVLQNINHVLFWYPGVDGVKPGFTDAAGICQVLDARRDGRHVVVAILNTPNLVTDARNLLDFGLRDFSWVQSPLAGDKPSVVQTGSGSSGQFQYFPASGHYLRPPFLASFQKLGGLAVLGYPRTESLEVRPGVTIQYFENGALQLDRTSAKVTRVALGSQVVLPSGSRRSGLHSSTATTPTPTPTTSPGVAPPFRNFVSKRSWLGSPLGAAALVAGHLVQGFSYGAVVANGSHALLLPVGDRFLSANAYLPLHPGDSYPAEFASLALLSALSWT